MLAAHSPQVAAVGHFEVSEARAAVVAILAWTYLITHSLFVRLQAKHILARWRFYPVWKPAVVLVL